MTNPTSPFNHYLLIPILNLLFAFYKAFDSLHFPGAFGWSIIAATALIRLILYPLTVSQIKSAHKMSSLKPQLDNLARIHKNDKQRLQQEQLKLYKEAGINPAAGCLPLLLQMPILIALYNVFFQVLGQGNNQKIVAQINHVLYFPFLHITKLDLSFFGLHLAAKPSDWTHAGWWLLTIPLITAALQYWQTKLMTPPMPSTAIVKKADDKEKKEDDMSTVMQKQMSIMMPLMIGFFAYSFPVGLSFYWNTFTIFGIIQQLILNKELYGQKNKRS